MDSQTIIIATSEQLEECFNKFYKKAVETQPKVLSEERKAIRSIEAGAAFLGCSKPKFQQLKNSGSIRKYQTGRKFIIWTDELMEDLAK